MQNLLILGSTGSVGKSTLDVVAKHTNRFNVFALTANTDAKSLFEQCQQYSPEYAVMSDSTAAAKLKKLANDASLNIKVLSGEQALIEVAAMSEVDSVMSAIVGAAGLLPTLTAVQAGKRVLIANKEPLVMTGSLFIEQAKLYNATILPIDSEHNAIFQCMPADYQNNHTDSSSTLAKHGVKKIHLTASGGPFLGTPWNELKSVTPEQACAHPNWSMGQKISVDSATMMNKGLELIEAVALFDLSVDDVNVVMHPQSIIHSMVEYVDGTFLAQLGSPDMKIPIAHALSWPDRIESGAATLDLFDIARLDFQRPVLDDMPCLRLAQYAAAEGLSLPATLNAANEIAVEAFLAKKIRFTDIPVVIENTLEKTTALSINSIDDVLNIDNEARAIASLAVNSLRI